MEEKYKTAKSKLPDNISLVNEFLSKGYKLINVVPRFFSDGTCAGYTYWFESISEI
jgi:hypothetical protein